MMNEQINIESLIGKYHNGTINDDELRELRAWIARSKENELFFDQIREILLVSSMHDKNLAFDAQPALERVKTKAGLNRPVSERRKVKSRKVITLSYRWAAAAAILLIFGGTLLYRWTYPPFEFPDIFQEVIVPLGSRSEIVLPDGSRVNLNAGSTLRYNVNFGIESRDLWLDGEGFFDVRKSAVPFIVRSGTVQIKAVGTSFNVRAYSSEKHIETTLVNGKVIVTDTDHRETASKETTLLPNQKLIIARSRNDNVPNKIASQPKISAAGTIDTAPERVVLKEKIDPVPDISWKDNKWIIDREDLESLAVKLERRFDIEIVFKDEQLKSYRYNGSLPDLSLEQVLNVMSMVSPINYLINGKTVVFSENKKYKQQ